MIDTRSATVELLKSALAPTTPKPRLKLLPTRYDDSGRRGEGAGAEHQAADALQSMSCAVVIADVRRRVTYLNPEAERITGWKSHEACGAALEEVLRMVALPNRQAAFWARSDTRADRRRVDLVGGAALLRRDGTSVPVNESTAPLRDADGRTRGVVVLLQDVTHQRREGRKLYHEATHDPLTDLFNRRAFEHHLTRATHTAPTAGTMHALIALDLDGFKGVNDGAGHDAGDAVLRRVAQTLRSRVRRGDCVARLGGDEFAILLRNCPPKRAEKIAEAIRAALAAPDRARHAAAHVVTGSLGLLFVPRRRVKGADLLRRVDEACYRAKHAGGNRVEQSVMAEAGADV